MFAATIGTGVLVAGCADGCDELTGPEHPPIPSFSGTTTGEDNCAVWSCEIQDCQQDPAQYGACCTEITDPGQPGVPKPSCDGSGGGGGGGGGEPVCDGLNAWYCASGKPPIHECLTCVECGLTCVP